jgi:hypothetical protein
MANFQELRETVIRLGLFGDHPMFGNRAKQAAIFMEANQSEGG